jgi:lipoprotein-anchoring transpeptidase ErfK/SrfK
MQWLRRSAIRLLTVPAVAAVACAAAPAAGRAPQPIALGVTVAGLPLGGFGSEEARASLRRGLDSPVTFQLRSRRWSARTDQLGAYLAVDAAVAEALSAPPGADVDVAAAVVPGRLAAYVAALDRRFSRPARDARLTGLDARLRPVVAPEAEGRKLLRGATQAAIARALRLAQREPVVPVFRTTAPRVTRQNLGPIIVIHRESKGLHVYEHGRLVRRIAIATGQARYPTPLGTFTVADMQLHPWWYPPDSDWARGLHPVAPGPGNPLGTRWMGLSAWGVGMHGTPDAASIGYSASHGCIRMRIPDAEWLYQRVRIGTPVVIVYA